MPTTATVFKPSAFRIELAMYTSRSPMSACVFQQALLVGLVGLL